MSTGTQQSQRMPNSVSGSDSMVERLERGTEQYIEEYPASAALVTFLSGVGAGFLLTTLLVAEQKKRSRQNVAERLGHQVLEYLNDAVPKSLSERFHR